MRAGCDPNATALTLPARERGYAVWATLASGPNRQCFTDLVAARSTSDRTLTMGADGTHSQSPASGKETASGPSTDHRGLHYWPRLSRRRGRTIVVPRSTNSLAVSRQAARSHQDRGGPSAARAAGLAATEVGAARLGSFVRLLRVARRRDSGHASGGHRHLQGLDAAHKSQSLGAGQTVDAGGRGGRARIHLLGPDTTALAEPIPYPVKATPGPNHRQGYAVSVVEALDFNIPKLLPRAPTASKSGPNGLTEIRRHPSDGAACSSMFGGNSRPLPPSS